MGRKLRVYVYFVKFKNILGQYDVKTNRTRRNNVTSKHKTIMVIEKKTANGEGRRPPRYPSAGYATDTITRALYRTPSDIIFRIEPTCGRLESVYYHVGVFNCAAVQLQKK